MYMYNRGQEMRAWVYDSGVQVVSNTRIKDEETAMDRHIMQTRLCNVKDVIMQDSRAHICVMRQEYYSLLCIWWMVCAIAPR